MRDIHNNIDALVALTAQVISTDTTTVGEIIDTRDVDGVELLIQSATITDGAYAVLVESGDDAALSDAAAIEDKYLLGTEADAGFALADDDTVKTIGVKKHGKRYVRLSIVSTATTSGGTLSATAIVTPYHTA